MIFLVFSCLIGVYASAAGSQDFGFVCGFEPSREEGATGQFHDLYLPFYQRGTVRPVLPLASWAGAQHRRYAAPDSPLSARSRRQLARTDARRFARWPAQALAGERAHLLTRTRRSLM